MRGKMAKRQAGYRRRSCSWGMSWGNNWIISSWNQLQKALFNSFWLLLRLGSHFYSTGIHWGLLSARFCSGGCERSLEQVNKTWLYTISCNRIQPLISVRGKVPCAAGSEAGGREALTESTFWPVVLFFHISLRMYNQRLILISGLRSGRKCLSLFLSLGGNTCLEHMGVVGWEVHSYFTASEKVSHVTGDSTTYPCPLHIFLSFSPRYLYWRLTEMIVLLVKFTLLIQ